MRLTKIQKERKVWDEKCFFLAYKILTDNLFISAQTALELADKLMRNRIRHSDKSQTKRATALKAVRLPRTG
jgi:hypothetical protein